MRSRLVWLLLCCIWGSTWLFIKLGLADLPPLTFAGIRFLIASAILLGIVAVRRVPLPRTRADWLLLAITGILAFSLNYGLLFWGEQYISSGLAALLQVAAHLADKLAGGIRARIERNVCSRWDMMGQS